MRFYALKASTFSLLSELAYEQLKEVYENCNHVYFNHTILAHERSAKIGQKSKVFKRCAMWTKL